MSRQLLAVLALTAVLGAGCGAAPPPTGSTAPTNPQLPLDRYQLTPPEREQVSRAHRALIEQCMRRHGLDSPKPTAAPETPRTLNERRYGLTGSSAIGYRLSTNESHPQKDITASADAATLPVAARCSREAQGRLNHAAPEVPDVMLAYRLSTESFTESEHDPRVQTAIRQWCACMRTSSFHYPSPLEVAADPRFDGALSTLEIRTASADIACKLKTNLVGIWSTVETEAQRSKIAANQPALNKLREMNQAQLKVARSLDS